MLWIVLRKIIFDSFQEIKKNSKFNRFDQYSSRILKIFIQIFELKRRLNSINSN